MAGDRREQVFVSSTYLDLREERQSVIQALLIAGCIPAGMELFPAGNDEKWRLIQRVINECDYYVLVIGGKYGSLDPTTELSYTEMEFDYAESIGKPIMAFLHGEPGKLTGDQIELDKERREKLDAFREKVEAARVVKYWNTPAELPGHVALALMETREHYPAEGWVRASQAMTPEQKTEIAELRARVAELVQATEAKDRQQVIAEDLAQGSDAYSFSLVVVGYRQQDLDGEGDGSWGASQYRWTVAVPVTWNEILQVVGPTLLHESSEPELTKVLLAYGQRLWRERYDELKPENLGKQTGSAALGSDVVTDVLVQLFAIGVIERGLKKRTVSDKNKYWALTELGQDQMMKLRAIRRVPNEE
ncbi:DUF4062 domain-containing protein [Microbacterium sp. 3H14]|uniref:DUF4062 domain-containing protein n=1 Tax=Microbacterium sp. 3H14 TaxID=2555725 RepID=UPI00106A3DCB|nr:DUF4062 domain-containing protein [Microbacterium sp. 3H14]TFB15436.1 DUF4062 domain-containing protein [Microbacterium sp. 3H14]